MAPNNANGKICYLEIPASDISASSAFYEKVFGWKLRTRGDGAVAFDDTVGGVSGTWVKDRAPAPPGILTYIMVDSVVETIDKILASAGGVDQPVTAIGTMTIARFRDPAGNVFGLYQQD